MVEQDLLPGLPPKPLHPLPGNMCHGEFDLLIGQPCSETFLEGSHPTHSAFDHFMLSIYDYVLFM